MVHILRKKFFLQGWHEFFELTEPSRSGLRPYVLLENMVNDLSYIVRGVRDIDNLSDGEDALCCTVAKE